MAIRPRYIFFMFLLIFVPLLDMMTDPDNGIITSFPFAASLITYVVMLGRALLALLALHWAVWFIFDRPEYKFHVLMESPEVKASIPIAIAIFSLAFSIVIHAIMSF